MAASVPRIAGAFYLLTFITGSAALLLHGRSASAAVLIAAVSYVAVTVLFYFLFKPVNKALSLLAAVVSLAGCAGAAFKLQPLVFFGFYCLLIGYLIFRSTFLPHVLGLLMAFAGLGWLTFFSATLAHSLYPYNFAPGILGEGVLTLWLLVNGVRTDGDCRPA